MNLGKCHPELGGRPGSQQKRAPLCWAAPYPGPGSSASWNTEGQELL